MNTTSLPTSSFLCSVGFDACRFMLNVCIFEKSSQNAQKYAVLCMCNDVVNRQNEITHSTSVCSISRCCGQQNDFRTKNFVCTYFCNRLCYCPGSLVMFSDNMSKDIMVNKQWAKWTQCKEAKSVKECKQQTISYRILNYSL